MITLEKINIFNRYEGDYDGLARHKKEDEMALFDGNNDWNYITSFKQDIELINKKLAAKIYIERLLKTLRKKCDPESFEVFTSELELYKYFKDVATILKQIKKLTTPASHTIWAGYDHAEDFINELAQDISALESCNFSTLEQVNLKFAPTGTYQEIAISNNWGFTFLQFATEFDLLYKKLADKIDS